MATENLLLLKTIYFPEKRQSISQNVSSKYCNVVHFLLTVSILRKKGFGKRIYLKWIYAWPTQRRQMRNNLIKWAQSISQILLQKISTLRRINWSISNEPKYRLVLSSAFYISALFTPSTSLDPRYIYSSICNLTTIWH